MEDGLRWRLVPSALAAIVALATAGLCLGLPRRFPPGRATISIDLQASGGKTLQVFVNDVTSPPFSRALDPGVRRTHTFRVESDVVFLRIDPTDAARVIVDIYAVELTDNDGGRTRFGPNDLSRWGRANVRKVAGDTPAFRLLTTTDDPILQTTPNFVLSQSTPAWLLPVVRTLRSRDLLLTASVVGWMAWAVVGVRRRERWAYLPVTGAALASVFWLVPLVAGLEAPPPPVDMAVGRAAVMGESLRAQQVATLSALSATALVGLAAGLVGRKRRGAEVTRDLPASSAPSGPGQGRRILWLAAVCGIITVAYLPDLSGLLAAARVQEYLPDWDRENILYWAYLVSEGAIPYRDFWYPYAGFFLFDRPAATGPLLEAAYKAAVLCLFALAFHQVSGRRVGVTLAAPAVLLLGDHSGLFPALHRYLLAVNVLLSYVGIEPRATARGGGYTLFWLACGIALLFEPAQLLYAAPGIAIVTAFDAFDHTSPGERRRLAGHLLRVLAGPAVMAGAYLAWMHHRGQLEGFLAFYLVLDDITAYSAIPTHVAAFATSPHSGGFLVLLTGPLLTGIGLFERLRGGPDEARTGNLLIGLGIVATMTLQKGLVRGIGLHSLFLFPLGAFGAIFLLRARRSSADQVVIGGLLGAAVAAFAWNGGARALAAGVLDAPRRLVSGWSALRDTEALEEARREAFAEPRFVRFVDERALAHRLRALNGGRPPEVFALSDAPILYILLQRCVYHANVYNASPIYEQGRIVDWLASQEVPFVIFDPSNLTYDGFAKAVRAPLVFTSVVQNYVPAAREGRYEIVRRRRPEEPIALAYWREKLGPSISLGHLPRLANVTELKPCLGPSTPCQELAEVRLAESALTRVSLPIEIQGLRYKVNFEAVPGVTRYYVNLDRIWFWSAARAAGVPARLATERMLPTSVTRMKVARPDVLY